VEGEAAVVIGVDAHKRTHTLVAADELGRELASKTFGGDGQRASGGDRLGGPVAEPALGDRGLPTSHPDAGSRPAARRRARGPGADADDGRRPAQRSPARQVRRDRRARGRASCVARARSARRPARRPVAPGAVAGRPSRRPGRRANPRAKPDPLAPTRDRTGAGDPRPRPQAPARRRTRRRPARRPGRVDRRDLPRAA
jgi:hypothetical protein